MADIITLAKRIEYLKNGLDRIQQLNYIRIYSADSYDTELKIKIYNSLKAILEDTIKELQDTVNNTKDNLINIY